MYDAGKPLPIANLGGDAQLGCGAGTGGQRRQPDGRVVTLSSACDQQLSAYRDFVARHPTDLAVVLFGPNDLYDRQIPRVCATWCHLGTQPYDSWLRGQMLQTVDALASHGAQVVWLTTPDMPDVGDRTHQFDQMIRQLPSERPGKVVVLDLAGYLRATGHDHADRPDGIHQHQRRRRRRPGLGRPPAGGHLAPSALTSTGGQTRRRRTISTRTEPRSGSPARNCSCSSTASTAT